MIIWQTLAYLLPVQESEHNSSGEDVVKSEIETEVFESEDMSDEQ